MELIESFKSETYLYRSVDEKVGHRAEMLNDGWEIDEEGVLAVTYTKNTLKN